MMKKMHRLNERMVFECGCVGVIGVCFAIGGVQAVEKSVHIECAKGIRK